MSQLTDKKLLYRTHPTSLETGPLVNPEWDDVIPLGHGREPGCPELAVRIGATSEPTGADLEEIGSAEAHPTLASGVNHFPTPSDSAANSQEEQQLVAMITELWSSSKTTKSSIVRSRAELADVRRELGIRLDAYKTLLSRAGRGGKWAGFLRDINVPLATADRMVEASRRASAENGKLLSEEVPVKTEVDIAKIVSRLKPRLARQLTTPDLVNRFLHALGNALQGSAPVAAGFESGPTAVPRVTAHQ